eukprot:6185733-Prymnesium_polylepis.1
MRPRRGPERPLSRHCAHLLLACLAVDAGRRVVEFLETRDVLDAGVRRLALCHQLLVVSDVAEQPLRPGSCDGGRGPRGILRPLLLIALLLLHGPHGRCRTRQHRRHPAVGWSTAHGQQSWRRSGCARRS